MPALLIRMSTEPSASRSRRRPARGAPGSICRPASRIRAPARLDQGPGLALVVDHRGTNTSAPPLASASANACPRPVLPPVSTAVGRPAKSGRARSRRLPRREPSCRRCGRRVGGVADPSTYRPAPGSIPTQPGVYRFRDEHGRVIYVGKAKNLRPRLSSYFQDIGEPAPAHRDDGHHRGQRRVDGGQHRGRGAPAGVLLDQGVRPALQRQVPRRQVLPLARGHDRTRSSRGCR